MKTLHSNVKVGRFRRSWEITKSSWRVLKLDKRLVLLPIFGLLASIAILVGLSWVFITVVFGSMSLADSGRTENFHGHWILLPIIVAVILEIMVVCMASSLFNGAVVYGANERLHGRKMTLRGSLKGSWHRLDQLTKFAILSASIGGLVQALSSRLPFAARLLTLFGLAAWSIATVFALPIIVLSDKPVGPFEAVKQSSKMLRKIWGEGLVTQLGVGLVTMLGFTGYLGLVILANVGLSLVHLPRDVSGTLFLLSIFGGLFLLMIFGLLSSIAKTALYYYATTGEAPELFSKELLHASLSVKKARRIFG